MKEEQEQSRTGKLWVMFMNFVAIIRMFIRAERTGNWTLHIKATQDMLPYFAAAGHNNYTKGCHLYLQDSQDLCPCLHKPLNDGLFTVCRNSTQFWSGAWIDMTIEQCLMRAGKTEGGLINITHKEAARTKWLLTAHVMAQYTEALRYLTDTFSGTWSQQHTEVRPAAVKLDHDDLQTFPSFLQVYNPFTTEDSTKLINIATGLVADDRVNVEEAVSIGQKVHEKITNLTWENITFNRSEQAKTFGIMRKAIQVNKKEIRMSSPELYQRLLSIACISGSPDADIFAYELASVAPCLFQDEGIMRKSQKSQLAKYIVKLDSDILSQDMKESAARVIDGCALLHRLIWPKTGTLHSVCTAFASAVASMGSSDLPLRCV